MFFNVSLEVVQRILLDIFFSVIKTGLPSSILTGMQARQSPSHFPGILPNITQDILSKIFPRIIPRPLLDIPKTSPVDCDLLSKRNLRVCVKILG